MGRSVAAVVLAAVRYVGAAGEKIERLKPRSRDLSIVSTHLSSSLSRWTAAYSPKTLTMKRMITMMYTNWYESQSGLRRHCAAASAVIVCSWRPCEK